MFVVLAVSLGLLIGSFLNVVAIRILKNESINFPPSHCVHCNHRLHAKDLIPVFSYLWLRGRCRYCREPVSFRYPVGELATGLLFAIAYMVIGYQPELLVAFWFISILVIITQTDIERMIIPDSVVLVGLIGAVGLRLVIHPYPYWNHLIAIFAGSGMLWLIGWLFEKLLKREAMGGGDIKLYTVIGAVLGVQLTLLSLFAASVLGLLYGLVQAVRKKRKAGQEMPFGPFIAGGSLVVYWWGERLLNGYMSLFSQCS